MTDNSHQFLASLDDLKHFRVTSIASFSECPRRWKANLLGEGEQKESPYARMGTAVHLCVEDYLRRRLDLPDDGEAVRVRLQAAGVLEPEVANCERYLLGLAGHRDRVVALEHEFTRSVVGHLPPIVGHIDAVFRHETEEKHLVIRDHKTNRTLHDAAWWRQQTQPRLYTWALREIYGDDYEITFEIGYVNHPGTIIRWQTHRSEDRAVVKRYIDTWHAFQVYQASGDWPEWVNENCSYCPLRKECGRLKRAQEEFLGALKKKQQVGWSVAQRYEWALNVQKTVDAGVEELKQELKGEIAQNGAQLHGDVLFDLKARSQRKISFQDMEHVMVDIGCNVYDVWADRLYSVNMGTLDALLETHPELVEKVEPHIERGTAATPTLVRKKVGKP